MNASTSFRRTIDRILQSSAGKTLDEFVAEERALRSSYANIARRLGVLTNHVIEIDPSTLYRWYEENKDREAV